MTMKTMLYPPIEHLKAIEIILTALKTLRREWMHTGGSSEPFAICCRVNTEIDVLDLDNKRNVQRLWGHMSQDAYETWPYWTGSHDFPVPMDIYNTAACHGVYELMKTPSYVQEYNKQEYWTGTYGQMRGALLEHLIKYISEERSYAQQQAATCKLGFAPDE